MFTLVPNNLLDNICLFFVIVVILYNYSCLKRNRKGTGYLFFVLFILFFSLLYKPVNGDFWNYLEAYQLGTSHPNHMEGIYNWLMDRIPNSFYLWRVAIWLPAAIFIAITFRVLKVPSNIGTAFFLMFGLINVYYYSRYVLALSVLFLALALFSNNKNKKRNFLFLIVLIGSVIASWYLHKSMPVYIVLALLALVLPLHKRSLLVSIIAFPALYGMILVLSSDLLNLDIWLWEGVGENYLEEVNTFVLNWKGVISRVLQYAPFFYFFFIAFRNPLPDNSDDFKAYKVFLICSFLVFYVSFLFMGQGSSAIQGRLYKSSMFPFAFVVSLYFKNRPDTKEGKIFIILVLFYYLFNALVTSARVA